MEIEERLIPCCRKSCSESGQLSHPIYDRITNQMNKGTHGMLLSPGGVYRFVAGSSIYPSPANGPTICPSPATGIRNPSVPTQTIFFYPTKIHRPIRRPGSGLNLLEKKKLESLKNYNNNNKCIRYYCLTESRLSLVQWKNAQLDSKVQEPRIGTKKNVIIFNLHGFYSKAKIKDWRFTFLIHSCVLS